jgi:hypothetical protein
LSTAEKCECGKPIYYVITKDREPFKRLCYDCTVQLLLLGHHELDYGTLRVQKNIDIEGMNDSKGDVSSGV